MQFVIVDDIEVAAMSYLQTPREKHPQRQEYPAFYDHIIAPGRYCDTRILRLGDGVRRLLFYTGFVRMMESEQGVPKPPNAVSLDESLQRICNDTVKGAYLVRNLRYIKGMDALNKAMARYDQYLLTDSVKAWFNAYKQNLATFKKGESALAFSYPDVSGKNVAFKDLRGKVVMVDVWATWCGPCKAEMPYLQQLEEEMKNKEVAFVSISLDVEKDKGKWLKMVQDQKLGGIQLFAGGWSDITSYYQIKGIPRFMVFDQQGRIVNTDAPRPSDPELKKLLEQTLQKKD